MISIHQSQFLPWLPYFYKIIKSDIFIIMDDVQYQKNSVQNRNMIKTPTGESYLTIPVISKSISLINEVEILNNIYLDKMLKTLKNNYSKAKYFDEVFMKIKQLVETKKYCKLNELNIDLIMLVLDLLNVKTDIKYSSEFNLTSKKDDLVLDLILASGEKDYITGSGGLEYMKLEKFFLQNINIYEYKFDYAQYIQLWDKDNGFIKHLSIVDLLFNDLDNAKEYILQRGSLFLIKQNR